MQTLRWRSVCNRLTGDLDISSFRREGKGRMGRKLGQKEILNSNAVSVKSAVKPMGSPEVGMTLLNCSKLG